MSDTSGSRLGQSKQEHLRGDLHAYTIEHGAPPDEVLIDLIAETKSLFTERAGMQIDAGQGAFLTLLTRIVAPRFVVEVGTFTGYSSICIARGLTDGASMLCCDVSDEFTSVARRYWDRAELSDRIELRLGPAADTLAALPDDTTIDMAFIDADKSGYLTYYEAILERMPSGGLIVVDNVMWHGQVVDISDNSVDTVAIRAFNDHVAADDRVEASMIPVGDGLTLARKC
jgi:caffeoyl-CoA O-methyltransferase